MKTTFTKKEVLKYAKKKGDFIEDFNLDLVVTLCNVKGDLEEGYYNYRQGNTLDFAMLKGSEDYTEIVEVALYRYANHLPFRCISQNIEVFISNLLNLKDHKEKLKNYLKSEGWYIYNNLAVCINN